MENEFKEIIDKTKELEQIIENSNIYQKYLLVLKQLKENKDIKDKINEIRKLQQYLVRNKIKDQKEEEKLNKLIKELEAIPLYIEYINTVDELNLYLEPIKKIQDYFDDLSK